MYDNLPVVKLGLVATSRDCFPIQLSAKRKAAVVDAYTKAGGEIVDIPTIIESETDAMKALEEVKANGCNALVVFLGNFGPEGPETMLADKFGGPTMFVAAAEETGDDLIDGRGDAYCGMLNASYSIGLKSLKNVYIPEYPVGTADEIASMICEFIPIAAVRIGLSNLKVFSFGPRPYDFIACNAPIKPLFDLGINIQENSELDLFAAFNDHANDPRIAEVAADKAKELGIKPMAKWVAGATAGVDPSIMGIGPAFSTKKLFDKTGLTIDQMDLIEANEAFAAQSLAVGIELGWDASKVNVNGGALALGHPVGASGCRILVTLLHEMKKRGSKLGLATLCIGGGMGCSTVVENIQ